MFGSTKSNVSRTSLNNNHNDSTLAAAGQHARVDFDSHTFRMPDRMPQRADGVVIRIPAVVVKEHQQPHSQHSQQQQQHWPSVGDVGTVRPGSNLTTIQLNGFRRYGVDHDADDDDTTGDLDNSQEELETSLNGKLTFEIYKELQKSQESVVSRDDVEASAELRRRVFAPDVNDDLDAEEDDDDEHYIDAEDDDDDDDDNDETILETQFSSLQLHKYTDDSGRNVGPDFYDVLPPMDSQIPHSVRLKTNPFTRQKELYTVNLGRIWKNLNLGQEEMSLEGNSMQGHFKKKNESFKSMSSQDSGFSLTLTKPKGLYRARSRKGKGRKNAGLDFGQWSSSRSVQPSPAVFPASGARGTASRRTAAGSKRRQSTTSIPSPMSGTDRYNAIGSFDDATLTRTLNRPSRASSSALQTLDFQHDHRPTHHRTSDGPKFAREFEEFCMRRNQTALSSDEEPLLEAKPKPSQFGPRPRADTFTKEINDLEAFFEEHLKRLKEYYLRKKQLTDRTIEDLRLDYDSHGGQHIAEPRGPSPPPSPDDERDFSFPHPDKRRPAAASAKIASAVAFSGASLTKQRSKFRAPEVRCYQPNFSVSREEKNVKQPAADYLAFPYGKLRLHSGSSRRSRGGWAKCSKLLPSVGQTTTTMAMATAKTEISLSAHHFPPATKCRTCCREVRRVVGVAAADDDGHSKNANDAVEFSEHEFILNSIGGELCSDCDKLETDCKCDDDDGDDNVAGATSMAASNFCDCVHDDGDDNDDNNDDDYDDGDNDEDDDDEDNALLNRNLSGKRKVMLVVKRKKSKRRSAGKNHSTLRRMYGSGIGGGGGVNAMSKQLCG